MNEGGLAGAARRGELRFRLAKTEDLFYPSRAVIVAMPDDRHNRYARRTNCGFCSLHRIFPVHGRNLSL